MLNMCLINAKDKSKHLSQIDGTMLKVAKIYFCWTDDEIQLLFGSANKYKCKCEYERINWESVSYIQQLVNNLLTTVHYHHHHHHHHHHLQKK